MCVTGTYLCATPPAANCWGLVDLLREGSLNEARKKTLQTLREGVLVLSENAVVAPIDDKEGDLLSKSI
jgi:hypothetical protein